MTTHLDPVRAWIGIDWADKTHEIALRLPDGQTERVTLDNQPKSMHDYLQALRERFAGGPVAIALEKTRSQLVNVLLQYAFVRLYLLNPGSVANYREVLCPSGAKDDPRDADVILLMLIKHADKLRPWQPDDSQTRLLRGLCEERRHAVDLRTKLVEDLVSKLKRYFPQAIRLAGEDLTCNMAADFLRKYPDLASVQEATDGSLRRFYHAHNCRSTKLIDERLQLRRDAVAVTDDQAIVVPLVLATRRLACQIRSLNESIAVCDRRIREIFPEHPDAAIFSSFPGAGPALAPRLLGEFGIDRGRYASASELQCHVGIAPVTEKSGKSRWVHRRWRCPKFSLQTFHEYAAASLHQSRWAKAYYDYRKAHDRNARHQSIVRALAYKWMRIMFACWQTRTPYDETQYIATLLKRHSPLGIYLM